MVQRIMNPPGIFEDAGLIPEIVQWDKNLALLWLWCRQQLQLQPLAWELPYSTGMALKTKKKKKKRKEKQTMWQATVGVGALE